MFNGRTSFAAQKQGAARFVRSAGAWLLLCGILCGYFSLVLLIGGHAHWSRLGVPALSPGFADLRSVTSGWDCARHHVGSWPANPCDPWRRPENYPRLWMAPAILGFGQSDTYALGAILVVTFFVAAILVLPGDESLGATLIYATALCSPAVMLGVERGNVDILLFAMIVVAGLLMRRTRDGPPIAATLILTAGILKLYPIAAIGMLVLLPRRKALACVAAVAGLFAIYAAATLGDIRTIERVVPQDNYYSYGVHIAGGWLASIVGPGRVWDVALLTAVLAGALALRGTLRRRFGTQATTTLDLFWAGAGIYAVTFALGRSFDYRLAFLLLTIPQLIRWASAGQVFPIATLTAILLTLWLSNPWSNVPVLRTAIQRWNSLTSVRGSSLPIASPFQLAVFAGLVCLLVATAPSFSSQAGQDPRCSRRAIRSRTDALRGRSPGT